MAEEGAGGGAFSDLLGDANIVQIALWSIISMLISPAMQPFAQALTTLFNSAMPIMPLSAAEAATAANRNFLTKAEAESQALSWGISADLFNVMQHLAGTAPAPGDLVTAARRKIIPWEGKGIDLTTFEQGISEGNLLDKWAPMMKGLATQWPTPTDALDALLEGQLSEDKAKEYYEMFGGDPAYFTLLFNTRGSAPTPTEAYTMANRGIIPWSGTGPTVVSFEQAFKEGPWRNKWLTPYQKLSEYYPPARTITTLIGHGSLTDAQAAAYYEKMGFSPELAAAYIKSAHSSKTATTKTLAESTVIKLYVDQLIDQATAKTMLEGLGYTKDDAAFIITVSDMQLTEASLRSAVSRVKTLYVSHKIAKSDAVTALNTMSIPSGQVTSLIEVWTLERAANVKVPTESQITGAFHYSIISQEEAISELQKLGYDPYDAWLILSVRNHGALPNKPAQTAVSATAAGAGGASQ